jgi:dTDP-4-dehydrorhamnose reductase
MLNVLITGSNGQVGLELQLLHKKHNNFKWFFTDRSILDITIKSELELFLKKVQIDIIVNCAAFTNVELAEDNFELSDLVNNLAVKNIALLSKKYKIKLIHLSTDAVFNGQSKIPYKEGDICNPLSVYAKTKRRGEEQLISINPTDSIILRTSWVYSQHGRNFLKTMLQTLVMKDEVDVIYDQIGTPTYAKDLAEVIMKIIPNINNENVEIYHYSNAGSASWYDFAEEINLFLQENCKINPVKTEEYFSKVSRPEYCELNKDKIINKFNINIPYWRDSLRNCLNQIEHINKNL